MIQRNLRPPGAGKNYSHNAAWHRHPARDVDSIFCRNHGAWQLAMCVEQRRSFLQSPAVSENRVRGWFDMAFPPQFHWANDT